MIANPQEVTNNNINVIAEAIDTSFEFFQLFLDSELSSVTLEESNKYYMFSKIMKLETCP